MFFSARVIFPDTARSLPHLLLRHVALPTVLLVVLVANGCGSDATTIGTDAAAEADAPQDGTTVGDVAGGSDVQADNDLSAGTDSATSTDSATGTDASAGCNKMLFAEVEDLIVTACGACHDTPFGEFKSTSCKSVAGKKSKIKSTVKSESMPPGGGLTAAEKAQIIKWVDDGGLCMVCP